MAGWDTLGDPPATCEDKTTKKTKKVFSPVRSSSIAGEDEDDFMDEEGGTVEVSNPMGGEGKGKRQSMV